MNKCGISLGFVVGGAIGGLSTGYLALAHGLPMWAFILLLATGASIGIYIGERI